VKLKVLGCSGGHTPGQGTPSFLVNDVLAIDAGSITSTLSLNDQTKVRDVLVSHAHLDHTCSLPFLIDNNFTVPGFSVRILGLPEVVASMKTHLFNHQTWPDFTCLPNHRAPVLRLLKMLPGRCYRVAGLKVRAVPVSHVVATAGFIIEDRRSAIAYTADTGPTRRFWQALRRVDKLRAVIAETSYPDDLQDLASASGHLTPSLLKGELEKLGRDVPVYVYGAKPRQLARIERQLRALGDPRVRLLSPGQTLRF
jgi:3',5'-cyclic-nucleotide phosphodiesterase